MRGKIALLAALVYAGALVCLPQTAAQSVRTGLELCGRVLLPALFPYLVLSRLLVGCGAGERLGRAFGRVMVPLFHLPGTGGAAVALGLLGGYPTGAAVVCALLEQGAVTPREAQGLLRFCNNAGPAFALSVAGSAVFGSLPVGAGLLAIHVLSALLTGLLLRPPQVPGEPAARPPQGDRTPGRLLTDAVTGALRASLSICAYVVLFQVLWALAEAALPLSRLPGPVYALLRGGLELSGGVSALAGPPSPAALVVCAFLLGWGGWCVHAQTAALLADTGLSLGPYLRGKLVHGLLSALLALAVSPVLGAMPCAGTVSIRGPLWLGWGLWLLTALALLRRKGCKSREG